jgi:hypothetical protein
MMLAFAVRMILKRIGKRRTIRLLVSRVDRWWRRVSGKDDLLYFGVIYKSRYQNREYEETGVLSARTVQQAARKADLARKVFEVPGWEDYCDYNSLVPISIRGYRLLRRRVFDIDSFFDKDDNLRV